MLLYTIFMKKKGVTYNQLISSFQHTSSDGKLGNSTLVLFCASLLMRDQTSCGFYLMHWFATLLVGSYLDLPELHEHCKGSPCG